MSTLHSDLDALQLHVPFNYIQDTDPGAVGAGKFWLDITAPPFQLWRRNTGDTDWEQVGGTGSAPVFLGSKAARSTNQSVADSTDVALSFDQNYYDSGAYLDPGGNPTRFTAAVGGYFQAGGNIKWASAAGGLRSIWIRKNGVDTLGKETFPVAPAGVIDMVLDVPIVLADGDYIEIMVRQESGGSINVLQTNFFSVSGWLNKIGSL